jgi:ATP-dependent DNA helicase RecQ
VANDIAALSIGSSLTLRQGPAGNWSLCDAQGAVVGRLARSFIPPKGMDCIMAHVASIHVRRLNDVGEEHRARIDDGRESWEMVVPELVFAPATRK